MSHKKAVLNNAFMVVFDSMTPEEQDVITRFSIKLLVVTLGADVVKGILKKYQKSKREYF